MGIGELVETREQDGPERIAEFDPRQAWCARSGNGPREFMLEDGSTLYAVPVITDPAYTPEHAFERAMAGSYRLGVLNAAAVRHARQIAGLTNVAETFEQSGQDELALAAWALRRRARLDHERINNELVAALQKFGVGAVDVWVVQPTDTPDQFLAAPLCGAERLPDVDGAPRVAPIVWGRNDRLGTWQGQFLCVSTPRVGAANPSF